MKFVKKGQKLNDLFFFNLQNFEDGSIEEREFVNGCKLGPATVKFSNGDYLELNYSDNLLNGEAK